MQFDGRGYIFKKRKSIVPLFSTRKMNNNLVKIDIIDDESLLNACNILHDGYCDLSTVKFDRIKGTWEAIFEREFFEDPSLMKFEPKFFFFHKVTFPMVRSKLSLQGIRTYNIEDKSNIQVYIFNECLIKNKIYKFFFCEDMEMTFIFEDTPKGALIDQELLGKIGSFYKWRNPFKKENRGRKVLR